MNAPPVKDGVGEPTPKQENAEASKPDQPETTEADKPKDPPTDKSAASVTKENFDKIEKGMTKSDLIALLGPQSENRGGGSFVWNGADGKMFVTAPQGKVVSKANTLGWPVVYPGDVAAAPPEKPAEAAKTTAPPDKAAVRLTQPNYDKIDKGMTVKDLIALLGAPLQTDKAGNPSDETSTWAGAATIITVTTHDGMVVNKSSNQNWRIAYASDVVKDPPPDKPGDVVTQANFDKIDKGMLQPAVTGLLGNPSQTLPSAKRATEFRLVWIEGSRTVFVTFDQGKVIEKDTDQRWPILYASDPVKNPAPDKPKASVTK